MLCCFFFFQAEDGIRDRSPSRGLGDVYKRQYIYDGSHGCVNMIPGQAQKLYKSIKRDTDVIIKK